MRKFILKSVFSLKWFFLVVLLFIVFIYFMLQGSVPDLKGQRIITALGKSVQIERDAQGIPTIRAKSRTDTAFALGYLHAQERFFQMDLLRRRAAGELSELFGEKALDADREAKIHRFRERAKRIYRHLPKEHYRALLAYTNGVNIGLDNLSGEPFQYLFLRQKTTPWELEDSLLCVFAMYLELNGELAERKKSLAIMKAQLPQQWVKFLTPGGGKWDSPLDGKKLPESQTVLTIPDAKLTGILSRNMTYINEQYQGAPLLGSNNWAIDASLSPYSSAMLANDMHLKLNVPNTWYRASWYLQDGRRVTGVTLPGMPVMVAGSNEQIAWGLTNTYGDWGNIVTLQTNENDTRYKVGQGWQDFSIFSHQLLRQTGKIQNYLTIESIWGPIIGKDHKGNLMAHQWVAYAPNAVNLNFMELEQAQTVSEALSISPEIGIPPQNLVVADKDGHIGWSIAGVMPKRGNTFDNLSETSSVWSGFLKGKDYPQLINPDNHRIWTANNRLFSGEELAKIGFEGGDLGARAQQIKSGLLAKEQFVEKDFLAIQLDDRAWFLQPWQQLLMDSLSNSNDKAAIEMINVLKKEPELAADIDSIAYGLVKRFRKIVVNYSIGWIFDALEQNNPEHFKRSSVDRMIEYPVWELVSKRPEHLVPSEYESWDEFLRTAAQQAYNELTKNGQELLQQQTWGKLNQVNIRHFLSSAIPVLGFLMDMPVLPVSGDRNMPKVMSGNFGASMRMVVSPGHERQGIMHMPVGQSNHPFSPYYSLGHNDWLNGEVSSFLPGKTKWTLHLKALQ